MRQESIPCNERHELGKETEGHASLWVHVNQEKEARKHLFAFLVTQRSCLQDFLVSFSGFSLVVCV